MFYVTCENFPTVKHAHEWVGSDGRTERCVPVSEANDAAYRAAFDAYYEDEPEPYPVPEWVRRQRESGMPAKDYTNK